MAIKTVTILPVSDISPLWVPTPDDGLSQASKIDEGVGNADGDVSKLSVSVGGVVSIYQLGALPRSLKYSTAVRCRANAKSDGSGANLGFLFVINGVEFFPDPAFGYLFDDFPSNTWTELDVPVPSFPVLHVNDVIYVALSCFPGGGTVSLTAFELEITYSNSFTVFTPLAEPSTSFTPLQTD